MEYISTRGKAPVLDFEGVLLAGLAPDGGLYVPSHWPAISREEIASLKGLTYPEIAEYIFRPFIGDVVSPEILKRLVAMAYSNFKHPAVAPLRQLDSNFWLLELFHGPTLAFKDFALQFLGHLFQEILSRRKEHVTIVGATSGDTGSAAIEACKDRDTIDIFILHPFERTSEIQRRQMTTVASPNVHNIAIEGTFDDCQDLVKAMFSDAQFREDLNLSAVNSINWVRIMAQIVYYFSSAVALGAPDRQFAYSVPTGNFGDIFAGYAAKKMGLPIESLIVGTNANDILHRFFEHGDMSAREVMSTLSPAMDIQVSSNFERLLFDLTAQDAKAVREAMESFRETGTMKYPPDVLSKAKSTFKAAAVSDDSTLKVVREVWETSGILVDPHTATGIHAAYETGFSSEITTVAVSTAHPAKFPDAIGVAVRKEPELPERLTHILEAEEHYVRLANDIFVVQDYVSSMTKKKAG